MARIRLKLKYFYPFENLDKNKKVLNQVLFPESIFKFIDNFNEINFIKEYYSIPPTFRKISILNYLNYTEPNLSDLTKLVSNNIKFNLSQRYLLLEKIITKYNNILSEEELKNLIEIKNQFKQKLLTKKIDISNDLEIKKFKFKLPIVNTLYTPLWAIPETNNILQVFDYYIRTIYNSFFYEIFEGQIDVFDLFYYASEVEVKTEDTIVVKEYSLEDYPNEIEYKVVIQDTFYIYPIRNYTLENIYFNYPINIITVDSYPYLLEIPEGNPIQTFSDLFYSNIPQQVQHLIHTILFNSNIFNPNAKINSNNLIIIQNKRYGYLKRDIFGFNNLYLFKKEPDIKFRNKFKNTLIMTLNNLIDYLEIQSKIIEEKLNILDKANADVFNNIFKLAEKLETRLLGRNYLFENKQLRDKLKSVLKKVFGFPMPTYLELVEMLFQKFKVFNQINENMRKREETILNLYNIHYDNAKDLETNINNIFNNVSSLYTNLINIRYENEPITHMTFHRIAKSFLSQYVYKEFDYYTKYLIIDLPINNLKNYTFTDNKTLEKTTKSLTESILNYLISVENKTPVPHLSLIKTLEKTINYKNNFLVKIKFPENYDIFNNKFTDNPESNIIWSALSLEDSVLPFIVRGTNFPTISLKWTELNINNPTIKYNLYKASEGIEIQNSEMSIKMLDLYIPLMKYNKDENFYKINYLYIHEIFQNYLSLISGYPINTTLDSFNVLGGTFAIDVTLEVSIYIFSQMRNKSKSTETVHVVNILMLPISSSIENLDYTSDNLLTVNIMGKAIFIQTEKKELPVLSYMPYLV